MWVIVDVRRQREPDTAGALERTGPARLWDEMMIEARRSGGA